MTNTLANSFWGDDAVSNFFHNYWPIIVIIVVVLMVLAKAKR